MTDAQRLVAARMILTGEKADACITYITACKDNNERVVCSDAVKHLWLSEHKIAAIKLHRAETNRGLYEAKMDCEAIK